ncbi:T9SS type A sorting domain-containing protein [Empedobacter brevis]|uniref:T9SS type A sorting domain-containing protein n=1 Tax=Empedobacter brevis TaxID=247 RepID=UPI0028992875|nr:T9SS type A sorting domain-containing protein [Empedobacter brevis]
MKKILLVFTLFIISNSFGQFNSDREAYLSLLQKLQKDPKRIYENSTSTISSTVTFKFINGVEKLISLRLSETFDNIQNPNKEPQTIDLTPELKQLNLAESLVIAPNVFINLKGNINTYKINFEELNNSIYLNTFVFKTPSNDNSLLETINFDKISGIPTLHTLGLYSLQIDANNLSVLESATQYKIKNFSISSFKPHNEYISNLTFSGFKNSLEKLTIEEFNGNLPHHFFNNLPHLKSFTHIGSFDTFPTNLDNAQNLEEIYLESYGDFNSLPSQISNLTNLKRLTIRTNQLQLPITFGDLKNLKSFEIRQSSISGLEPLEKVNSLENLTVFFYDANKKSLDLQNLNNLKKVIYKYDPSQLVDLHPEDYSLPNGVEKLTNLEYLDVSVSDLPFDIRNLIKLKRLHIEYINDDLFPKIDFSNNINLEYLTLNRFFNDYNTNILKTPRIKFDNDFEKLTNLSWIDFWNVPVEMDVTNKFNKLFNATHPDPNVTLLKYFAFNNLKSNISNKLDGTLNICNKHDIYLDIQGSSPKIIDYRNKSLTNSAYFFLDLKETDNPLIIVDDINKFKQTFGETYYNSTTQTDVAYNLTTSTEPCERSLTTVNINKTDVRIYPNPVVDILNIETDVNKNSIKIIDLTGKTIESYTINEKKISVQVNHLPKGIYIVEVENENGKTNSKFIKK